MLGLNNGHRHTPRVVAPPVSPLEQIMQAAATAAAADPSAIAANHTNAQQDIVPDALHEEAGMGMCSAPSAAEARDEAPALGLDASSATVFDGCSTHAARVTAADQQLVLRRADI